MDIIFAAPRYQIRGLSLCGFRDIPQCLTYLCDNGQIKKGLLIAVNAEKVLAAENDASLHKLLVDAEYRYADGISIVRSIQRKYPQAQISRIAGANLWEALMKNAGHYAIPVFLIGSRPEVLSCTEEKLGHQLNVNIVGSQNGYFASSNREAIFNRIRDSGAKIITVGMGSPRQEFFMRDCQKLHPEALYMGVGGTYDVFTGYTRRAPLCWQNAGLEWLYRLISQPSRLRRQLRLLKYLIYYYRGEL